MDFRILGPVEALAEDQELPLGGQRPRALLAYLLLRANQVVAADRLLDQLWAEPPGGGLSALQTQISRLRRVLGDRIVTSGAGYSIHVAPGELDLDRFRSLLAEAGASEDPARRSRLLRDADALWLGEPLAGLDAPFAATEAAALDELRLSALEDRLEADLELGHNGELASELSSLVASHPLRERLRGQLILALYRNGRQAEALQAYRETRRMLDDDLGLEPSPALRELERAILRHDPALTPAAPAEVLEPTAVEPRRWRSRRLAFAGALLLVLGAAGAAVVMLMRGLPASHPLSAVAAHAAPKPKLVTISDAFNGGYVDPTIWAPFTSDENVTVAVHDGLLVLTVTPHAVPTGTYNIIDVHVGTRCTFPGNFDARVDYALLDWPKDDNVYVGLNAIYANAAVMRESSSRLGDGYDSWVVPDSGSALLPDTSGSLRITRIGGVETTFFWHAGGWRKLATGISTADALPGLQAMSDQQNPFGRREVKVAFDNFSVTGVNPRCPPGVRS